MMKNYDFKKEWENTKNMLMKFSKEATKIAQEGEKEVIKFSKKSKLYVDSTSISLKKEKLYYLIGKEYVNMENPADPSVKLKKLLDDLKKANKAQSALQRKLKVTKK